MTINCSTFLDALALMHFVLWNRLFPNCSLGAISHLKHASVLYVVIAGGDCHSNSDLMKYLMSVCTVWHSAPLSQGWICLWSYCGWSAPVLLPKCHFCSGLVALCLFPHNGASVSYWPYWWVEIQGVFFLSLLPSLGEETHTHTHRKLLLLQFWILKL